MSSGSRRTPKASRGSAAEVAATPIEGSARFSRCGRYRTRLDRWWDRSRPAVLFIGLNPSTADAVRNDPTVRRCIGFAMRWGFGGLVVANAFAWRSTDPAGLLATPDPVGPGNDPAIAAAAEECGKVVAAWGTHGGLLDRQRRLVELLAPIAPLWCLGRTREGFPRHPLYRPAASKLERFPAATRSA